MRSKLNLRSSTDTRSANKLAGISVPLPSSMPMEWLDAGSWRLPSGKALAEFALQAGFLAPLLLKSDRFSRRQHASQPLREFQREILGGKHYSKGDHS